MGLLRSALPRAEAAEFQRNPVTCVAVTLAVATVFWAGLIWAAVRLYG